MANKPATPLPWRIGQVSPARFPAYPVIGGEHIVADVSIRARGGSDKDAAYIAHACNAYPRLMDMVRDLLYSAVPETFGDKPVVRDARALLAELGE